MPGQSSSPGSNELAELHGLVAELRTEIASLKGMLEKRDDRIAELERLLAEARRSGKRQAAPFSKGEPVSDPKRPGRKSGDAHGRHGHRMAPAGPIDRELDVPLPACCPHCGGEVELDHVAEQFEVDLPDPRPVTTKFNVSVGRCRSCKSRIQGRHPAQSTDALGAAASGIGPVAKSWAAWLHYCLGLSFGKSASVLSRLGVPATAGALCAAAQSTSTALVPVTEEIVRRLNASAMVVSDETGWRVCGGRSWLWAATSTGVTAYWVAEGRGYDQASQMIDPNYSGVMVRDGWAPYRSFTKATHQTCLAHLLRRCDELVRDLPEEERETPRAVRQLLKDALGARKLGPESASSSREI